MRQDRGITLIEVAVAAMLVLTAAAVLIPTFLRSRRHERLVECRTHLETLYKAQLAPGERPLLGTAYWTRLVQASPPAVDAAALRCPLASDEAQLPCDYLGPRQDPSKLTPEDPLGCDASDNHGPHGREGGNVLMKSGEVRTLHPREPGTPDPWRDAYQTKCGR
jgi:hypothetical protein